MRLGDDLAFHATHFRCYAQDLDALNARPVVVEVQNGYPLFLPQLQK